MSTEDHPELVDELRESYQKFGPIHKAIKTQFGVASGNTRLLAVAEWPVMQKQVKNKYEHLQIVAASNIHEDKPGSWWTGVVNEAAEELVKMRVPKAEIAQALVKDFPMTEKRILRYLRPEFKHPDKVRAGKASGEVRKQLDTTSRATLAGNSTPTYPIPERYSATYTPEELTLQSAFSRQGFALDFQKPVPMPKWKCGKCRETWIEETPMRCPKDGTLIEQLTYKIDLVVTTMDTVPILRFAVEPGGKQHDFESDEVRDAWLVEHGYIPLHFKNEVVQVAAWLIVEYVKALARLGTYEEHTIAFEGYARHVALDADSIFKEKVLVTKGPTRVKILIREKGTR